MANEAKRRANAKYDANNTKQIKLKLNLKTDADILARLDEVESKQGYIKALIRADMGATYLGYSLEELKLLAEMCRRQGIEEKELHDFVSNAQNAYDYIHEEIKDKIEKELNKKR